LLDAGLEILRFEKATLRQDRGAPIEGILVLARKPVNVNSLLTLDDEMVAEFAVSGVAAA
jgi:hypothetical protein